MGLQWSMKARLRPPPQLPVRPASTARVNLMHVCVLGLCEMFLFQWYKTFPFYKSKKKSCTVNFSVFVSRSVNAAQSVTVVELCLVP